MLIGCPREIKNQEFRVGLTPESAKELVKQLEQIMQEDAITIIPFWAKIYTASTDKVQGFAYHFARELYFEKVWLSA